MTIFPRRLFLFHLLMSAGLPAARAVDIPSLPGVSISGFGTVGFVHNSTGGGEFIRDQLQPRGVADGWSGDVDSRFGLQLNANLNDQIEIVVQGVSKYTYAGNYSPALTWAFASYAASPDLRIRAGRLGWDVYLLADSRDVGYSYLWVRPPVDYFGLLLLSYFDGGDVVYKHQFAGGLVSAKIYGGLIDQNIPVDGGDDFDLSGSTIVGGNLSFRKGEWLFRASYGVARIDKELPGLVPLLTALRGTGSPTAEALADDLGFAGETVEFASAGSAWEHGPWQAQLMYSYVTTDSLSLPTSHSGYFMFGYRHGKWSPYFTAAGTVSEDEQAETGFPQPNPLDAAVEMVLARSQSKQHTLSLGLRYDFMPNVDLKAQVDRVHVYDHATSLWRRPSADWDGDATLFSLTLDFVF